MKKKGGEIFVLKVKFLAVFIKRKTSPICFIHNIPTQNHKLEIIFVCLFVCLFVIGGGGGGGE